MPDYDGGNSLEKGNKEKTLFVFRGNEVVGNMNRIGIFNNVKRL